LKTSRPFLIIIIFFFFGLTQRFIVEDL
jgi:hypothetical protein